MSSGCFRYRCRVSQDPASVEGAGLGALRLAATWTDSPSDPHLSEHTRLAIADGSAYVAIDRERTSIITMSPTSLEDVGLVEMAGVSPEAIVEHWRGVSEDVFAAGRKRGYQDLEVIDRGSLLGQSIGSPGRSIVRMVLSSTGHPANEPVSGDQMPAFEDLAALTRKSFADHPENGGWTVGDVETRAAQPWFDPKGLFTESVPGRLIGFCWTKVHPEGVGEIYLVAVDPEFGGRGIGHRLVARALRYLEQARDCESVIVYLDESNETARRLYERSGFAEDRVDRRLRIDL